MSTDSLSKKQSVVNGTARCFGRIKEMRKKSKRQSCLEKAAVPIKGERVKSPAPEMAKSRQADVKQIEEQEPVNFPVFFLFQRERIYMYKCTKAISRKTTL
ncbi:hypothetical protein SD77_0269 [Bacillus badius]|uniref:Uncharacterized protein n=1 Tax=Bacillus badius TaxID=1455 RepID=A0ABR5B0B0_BACBA|nr:hypothetical protein SD77_0269 [Bacillus badius]